MIRLATVAYLQKHGRDFLAVRKLWKRTATSELQEGDVRWDDILLVHGRSVGLPYSTMQLDEHSLEPTSGTATGGSSTVAKVVNETGKIAKTKERTESAQMTVSKTGAVVTTTTSEQQAQEDNAVAVHLGTSTSSPKDHTGDATHRSGDTTVSPGSPQSALNKLSKSIARPRGEDRSPLSDEGGVLNSMKRTGSTSSSSSTAGGGTTGAGAVAAPASKLHPENSAADDCNGTTTTRTATEQQTSTTTGIAVLKSAAGTADKEAGVLGGASTSKTSSSCCTTVEVLGAASGRDGTNNYPSSSTSSCSSSPPRAVKIPVGLFVVEMRAHDPERCIVRQQSVGFQKLDWLAMARVNFAPVVNVVQQQSRGGAGGGGCSSSMQLNVNPLVQVARICLPSRFLPSLPERKSKRKYRTQGGSGAGGRRKDHHALGSDNGGLYTGYSSSSALALGAAASAAGNTSGGPSGVAGRINLQQFPSTPNLQNYNGSHVSSYSGSGTPNNPLNMSGTTASSGLNLPTSAADLHHQNADDTTSAGGRGSPLSNPAAMGDILRGYWMEQDSENVLTVWEVPNAALNNGTHVLGVYRGTSNLLLGRISFGGEEGVFFAEFGTDNVWRMTQEDACSMHGTWQAHSKGTATWRWRRPAVYPRVAWPEWGERVLINASGIVGNAVAIGICIFAVGQQQPVAAPATSATPQKTKGKNKDKQPPAPVLPPRVQKIWEGGLRWTLSTRRSASPKKKRTAAAAALQEHDLLASPVNNRKTRPALVAPSSSLQYITTATATGSSSRAPSSSNLLLRKIADEHAAMQAALKGGQVVITTNQAQDQKTVDNTPVVSCPMTGLPLAPGGGQQHLHPPDEQQLARRSKQGRLFAAEQPTASGSMASLLAAIAALRVCRDLGLEKKSIIMCADSAIVCNALSSMRGGHYVNSMFHDITGTPSPSSRATANNNLELPLETPTVAGGPSVQGPPPASAGPAQHQHVVQQQQQQTLNNTSATPTSASMGHTPMMGYNPAFPPAPLPTAQPAVLWVYGANGLLLPVPILQPTLAAPPPPPLASPMVPVVAQPVNLTTPLQQPVPGPPPLNNSSSTTSNGAAGALQQNSRTSSNTSGANNPLAGGASGNGSSGSAALANTSSSSQHLQVVESSKSKASKSRSRRSTSDIPSGEAIQKTMICRTKDDEGEKQKQNTKPELVPLLDLLKKYTGSKFLSQCPRGQKIALQDNAANEVARRWLRNEHLPSNSSDRSVETFAQTLGDWLADEALAEAVSIRQNPGSLDASMLLAKNRKEKSKQTTETEEGEVLEEVEDEELEKKPSKNIWELLEKWD
ncbi:unnamed protein product [Amoebophrya sp. A120]|nr:unnamed protein product [Amoebophrya sp. A120]|eukprot:GSA120T00020810001.1